MPSALLALLFVVAAAVSMATSWILVSRLERVGARLGLSEALLGMLAALAADAPEIASAVTALAGGQARIGAGVVIGSNVFNLASLLGLSAVVAGRIALHRRVILMEGMVALLVASFCLVAVRAVLAPGVALAGVLAILVPYLLALGLSRTRLRRLGMPDRWLAWIAQAIAEEESELQPAIHPRPARGPDEVTAVVAVVIVIGASVAMEQAGATIGRRYGWPEIVTGGLLLAGVTSLPNAVAALYLARRGRGSATLSTALNSNALNVAVGLLIPGTIVGLGAPSASGTLIALWYLGLTAVAVAGAYPGHGLRRGHGIVIIAAYIAFVVTLLATA